MESISPILYQWLHLSKIRQMALGNTRAAFQNFEVLLKIVFSSVVMVQKYHFKNIFSYKILYSANF